MTVGVLLLGESDIEQPKGLSGQLGLRLLDID